MRSILNIANWKIRTKIIGLVLFAVVVSILSLFAYNYFVFSSQSFKSQGEEMQRYGALALTDASQLINGSIKSLQAIALSPSIISAIETANKTNESRSAAELQQEIANLDKAWKDGDASVEPLVTTILANDTSAVLRKFKQSFPEQIEVFVTDRQGLNVGMTDRTGDYLQADEGWWKSAYNNGLGTTFISEVTYDESTKAYALDVGVPVFDKDHKTIGILRGTIDISVIFQTFANIRYGATGRASVIDQNGIIVYTSQQDLLMKPAPESFLAFMQGNSQGWKQGMTDLAGKASLVAYSTMTGDLANVLGWRVVIEQDLTEVNGGITEVTLQGLGIALFLMVVMVAAAYTLSNYISRPIGKAAAQIKRLARGDALLDHESQANSSLMTQKDEAGTLWRSIEELRSYLSEITNQAARIAQGDLMVEVTPRSSQDALGIAFSEMVRDLHKQVSMVAGGAGQLEQASEQLAGAARRAGDATGQIAITIRQVAQGTSEQADSIDATASSVKQMAQAINGLAKGSREQAAAVSSASQITADISSAIQQVTGNAQAVSRDSASAAEAARSGVKVVQQTVIGMESIRSKVGLSAEKVQEMGSRSAQIGAIVETIEDIASQTNLLALNAAIEAARAGEHGKGFAVVADEGRKLAERASAATKEIGGLIKGIQSTVGEAVKAMNEGAGEVEHGVDLANQAGLALTNIVDKAEAVYAQADQAAAASQRMAAASNKLVGAMDSVSAVVEANNIATTQMAASTSQVTQAIEHIASVSEQNSAAIEQVSASAEAMAAQIQEVTDSAKSLAELAGSLQVVVSEFKLSKDEAEAAQPVKLIAPNRQAVFSQRW